MIEKYFIYAGSMLSSLLVFASVLLSFVKKDIYRVNFFSGKIAVAVFDIFAVVSIAAGRISFGRALIIIAVVNLMIFINSASLTKSGMNNVVTPQDIEDRLKGK